MLRRHVSLEIQLIIVFIIITVLILVIDKYDSNIETTILVISNIGIVMGLLIPGLYISWLMLIVFFFCTYLITLEKNIFNDQILIIGMITFIISTLLSWMMRRQLYFRNYDLNSSKQIENYLQHNHPVTKLQGNNNAKKYYEKCIRFIKKMPEIKIRENIIYIDWCYSEQLKVDDIETYNKVLQDISKILKLNRLPHEQIYYLSNGSFMIISNVVSDELLKDLQDVMYKNLSNITYRLDGINYQTQYKLVTLGVDSSNVNTVNTFEKLLKRFKRKLEVAVIIEYQ